FRSAWPRAGRRLCRWRADDPLGAGHDRRFRRWSGRGTRPRRRTSEESAVNTRAADPNRRPGRLAWKNRVSAQAKLVVVLVAGIAMLSAACGRDADDEAGPGSGPATSTTRQLEAVPAPDPGTPEGVAVAALREIYTWKPVSEDQGASLVRARKWLGPSLIRVIEGTTAAGETPKPTLRWAEWAGAGARIDAFTFASG